MHESQAHAAAGRSGDAEPTILVSANSCWNIVNFRSGLIRGLSERGYRIVVAAPHDEYRSKLADLGVAFVPVPINSLGISVLEDSRLLARYLQVFRELRPFAFLGFTAKPNIYGSLAARMVGAKVINNVSGLGTVFIKRGPLTALVTQLYRISLRTSATIFFQNRDDLELFVAKRIARRDQAQLLPGSGVDPSASSLVRRRRPTARSASCSLVGCCGTRASQNMSRRRASSGARTRTPVSRCSAEWAPTTGRRSHPRLSNVGGPKGSSNISERATTCGRRWSKRAASSSPRTVRGCRGRCSKVQR